MKDSLKTTTIAKTVLTIAVAVTLLTGCATTSSTDLLPTSTTSATTTETPATVLTTGDLVAGSDVQTMLKAGNGQRAYPMADGTFVVVTKNEPLPAQVQADIDAKTAATLATVPNYSADMNAAEATLEKAQGDVAVGTGKRVLVVWRALAFWSFDAEIETYQWLIAGGPALGEHWDEKSQAQAVVDEWLAAKDNANEYVVVYVG